MISDRLIGLETNLMILHRPMDTSMTQITEANAMSTINQTAIETADLVASTLVAFWAERPAAVQLSATTRYICSDARSVNLTSSVHPSTFFSCIPAGQKKKSPNVEKCYSAPPIIYCIVHRH